MDRSSRLLDSSPLSIQCRQCGLGESDDYEVVEVNKIQSMRCTGCGTVMHFAVIECSGCGAETLVSLSSPQASEELRSCVCAACERHYVDEPSGTLAFR